MKSPKINTYTQPQKYPKLHKLAKGPTFIDTPLRLNPVYICILALPPALGLSGQKGTAQMKIQM